MPKQIYNIRAFHGGLNSNSDARDIAENELHEAVDIMVDKIGQTRMMGAASTMSPPAARANSIEPGYGLFQFSHDRVDGHTSSAGSSDEETGADYLAFSDPDTDGNVSIYSAEDTTWGNPITGMTNNTGGQRKDVFYFVDGNLRVCDSNFGNSNTPKWYGYIKKTHFSGIQPQGSTDSYDAWYCKEASLTPPTRGLVGDNTHSGTLIADASSDNTTLVDAAGDFKAEWEGEINQSGTNGHLLVNYTSNEIAYCTGYTNTTTLGTSSLGSSGVWDSDTYAILPPIGKGFNLSAYAVGTGGGNIPAADYEFASSFVYDAEPGQPGEQESLLFKLAGGITVASTNTIAYNVHASSPFDPRISGGRIYTRVADSDEDWRLFCEISLEKGVRNMPQAEWTSWSLHNGSHATTGVGVKAIKIGSSSFGNEQVTGLLPLTYQMMSGVAQDSDSIALKWKTAVVANRMVYAGNVQYNGKTFGDAVFQSPVNKFDVFSNDREMSASINDGDSIIKLEEYADRLLQFKKKKLQIINIAQLGSEFLEGTFMHKGVSHHAATCKTDFGIAWVNEQGCYLYDGQKIDNLLEKGGRQIIKESDWATFATANSMIGYIPSKRQILVVKDCTHSSVGDVFLYDIVTQSWVYGNSRCSDSIRFTNFVTDWNGDLIYIETDDTGTPKKWPDASGSSTGLHIQTKDLDFGQPGVRKKIYKVYITYRGDASNVQVNYGSDGGALSGTFFTITSGTDGSTTGGSAAAKCLKNAGTDDWLKAELKPSASINNVASFQLKLHGDGSNAIAADFEIDSISIVYRTKGIK